MADASPAKWHLAHTTWFFESFVLRDHAPGYRLFDDSYPFLFNSYYKGEGQRHARPRRGLLTPPSLGDGYEWHAHVTAAVRAALHGLSTSALTLVAIRPHLSPPQQELRLPNLSHPSHPH